jgi:hypothetical protein
MHRISNNLIELNGKKRLEYIRRDVTATTWIHP